MLISLLIGILVLGLIIYVIGLIPLPAPFGMVARVVVAIICLIWLLSFLTHGSLGGLL